MKANQKQKIYKALYKVCSKDTLRPVMTGIFHDNGKLVATDGHIMSIVNYDHDPECNGKIISKTGEEITGRFPVYRSVIEPVMKEKHDCTEIFEACKIIRKYNTSLNDGCAAIIRFNFPEGYAYMRNELLYRLVQVYKAIGEIPELSFSKNRMQCDPRYTMVQLISTNCHSVIMTQLPPNKKDTKDFLNVYNWEEAKNLPVPERQNKK